MMRVWILLAALAVSAPASADNILMKNKALGAALAAGAAVDATALILHRDEPWYGYPKGDDGPHFSDDGAGLTFGDCLDKEGGAMAKALMAQKDTPKEEPKSLLRLTEPEKHAAAGAYDSKAMYQGGTASDCPGG